MNNNKSFLRNIIGEHMTEIGRRNDKVVVVNADLSGTCRNKGFAESFPNRAFNTGIAEQNMVSFAAGLACEGFIPFAFSMAPFLTMRACEQCRTDVAYGNKNVKLIGVYAGVSGGISGATHWGIEDCGIMSAISNVVIYEVSDAVLARKILDYVTDYNGPVYIRSSVEPTIDIYSDDISVRKGGSIEVKAGGDAAILCSGVIVQYALEASERIYNSTGKKVRVVDMYSIKPVDSDAIVEASKTGNILVAQDHNIYGGLGSMVADVFAKMNLSGKFKVLGINDEYVSMAHAPFLYHLLELDAEGLEKNIKELWASE